MKTRINKGRSDSSSQPKFACFLRATASSKTRITLATLLWLVTCALAPAQGTADTAYVTLLHPDGTRAFYSLPGNPGVCDRGAKLQQAKTAAQPGDTIVVGPGEAHTNNLLKDRVNWHFMAGAKLVGECCPGQTECTGNVRRDIFADGPHGANGPVTCTISGEGVFESALNLFATVISLVDSSNISFTADTMLAQRWCPVYSQMATLHVRANSIRSNDASYPAVWWVSGPLHVEAHEIISNGIAVLSSAVSNQNAGYLWIQANLIKSTDGDAALSFTDAAPNTRHWIQALQIEGQVAISKGPTTGPGLTYVRAERIFGQIDHQGGDLYVDAMQIAPWSAWPLNDNLIKLSGTNSWVNIQQIDDTGLENSTHTVAAIAVSAGTHYLRGSSLARMSAGNGISVSGGALTVNGLAVSTLENSKDLLQTGGTLKVLSCGYTLMKTSGAIIEGDPKVGILGTAAFEARRRRIDLNGVFKGIIGVVTLISKGHYQVHFGRSEPDTNYMVTAIAESVNGAGTVCFSSNKTTDGFVLNLVDLKSGGFDDQDGVRVTVSRTP